MNKKLCGIDEAGRGPLAGDLVMAGVVLNYPIDGLADSKKLTPKKREALYEIIIKNSQYHIVSFSPKQVDELGISKCLHNGLIEIQINLPNCDYLFDGNSSFGVDNIETLIKADTKIVEVSAGSILAKVTHDRDMIEMSKIYPQYGFERHKGYGTKAHTAAILKYGRCPVHRESFRVKGLE
ncbi:MAG: ribonuclease HII [Sulfurovum sp.]